MKINRIEQQNSYYRNFVKNNNTLPKGNQVCSSNVEFNPVSHSYFQNITFKVLFKGLNEKDNERVKSLLNEDIRCLYSGKKMISSNRIDNLCKSNKLNSYSKYVIPMLEEYKECLFPVEHHIYNILRETSQLHPDKNIQEILEELAPVHKKNLRTEQAPIFKNLQRRARNLPAEQKERFQLLMAQTQNQLNEIPIVRPFRAKEFSYKLQRISEDIYNPKVRNKLEDCAKRMSHPNTMNNTEREHKIIDEVYGTIRNAQPEERGFLQELCESSLYRLYGEAYEIPFSRKSFIYDLDKLLNDLPDIEFKKLREELMSIAKKLPSSQESISAFIVKHAKTPPTRIVYDILSPSMATLEHIKPQNDYGPEEFSNYALASSRENRLRDTMPLDKYLKKNNDSHIHIQNYINKLIDIKNNDSEGKYKITTKEIYHLRSRLHTESNNKLKLDILELVKG